MNRFLHLEIIDLIKNIHLHLNYMRDIHVEGGFYGSIKTSYLYLY